MLLSAWIKLLLSEKIENSRWKNVEPLLLVVFILKYFLFAYFTKEIKAKREQLKWNDYTTLME